MGELKWEVLDSEFFENYTSEHTRLNYQIDLQKFQDFLQQNYRHCDLKKVKREHVIKYRNWLGEVGGQRQEGHAPKTIARKLAALSSYFHYLVQKGDIDQNPVTSVKRPRLEVKSPTHALSRDQVRALMEAIESEIKEEQKDSAVMHKALLLLFFTTGLRKNEILQLKYRHYRDINEMKILEFVGKGGKIGQKVVHEMAVDALHDYLQRMKTIGREHGPEDWLFQPTVNPSNPANLNKPLNPKTINEILLKYAKKIGLNFPVSPHSARATFIGELLELGVDIYSVAREVNHSSVKTTQEYDKRRKRISDSPVFKLRY